MPSKTTTLSRCQGKGPHWVAVAPSLFLRVLTRSLHTLVWTWTGQALAIHAIGIAKEPWNLVRLRTGRVSMGVVKEWMTLLWCCDAFVPVLPRSMQFILFELLDIMFIYNLVEYLRSGYNQTIIIFFFPGHGINDTKLKKHVKLCLAWARLGLKFQNEKRAQYEIGFKIQILLSILVSWVHSLWHGIASLTGQRAPIRKTFILNPFW